MGVADAIIPEPPDGAPQDPLAVAASLRGAVLTALAELTAADAASLLTARYERFRGIGAGVAPASQMEVRSA
jgi:acetyl-CoA carboxylase alpha subunit